MGYKVYEGGMCSCLSVSTGVYIWRRVFAMPLLSFVVQIEWLKIDYVLVPHIDDADDDCDDDVYLCKICVICSRSTVVITMALGWSRRGLADYTAYDDLHVIKFITQIRIIWTSFIGTNMR